MRQPLDDKNENDYRLFVTDKQAPMSLERAVVPDGELSRPDAARLRRVKSSDLLGAKGELVIEHAGREYRLRLTQNGKLILTA
jgi:hemin uptake protein HemP